MVRQVEKDARLTFRLPLALRRRLEQHAAKVDRKPAYILNAALESYLDRHAPTKRS